MASPNPNVVSYIERHLEKGVSIKKVRRALADAGHPITAIEEATEYVFQTRPHLQKKPKKMLFVYLAIFFIVLSVVGVFAYFKLTETVDYVEKVNLVEEKTAFSSMTDQEILLYAASKNDTLVCSNIDRQYTKDRCFAKVWQFSPCNYQKMIGSSADACYYDLATKEKDVSVCKKIIVFDIRHDCLRTVALELSPQNAS